MQRELPNGLEIKNVSTVFAFLDIGKVSAAIDGKYFKDKHAAVVAGKKPCPASVMFTEGRLVFTDVEKFSSTVTDCESLSRLKTPACCLYSGSTIFPKGLKTHT